MRKLLLTLILAIPISATARPVTLEQCQDWARENNPMIKRYDLIHQTADFTMKNIAKGWLPQIGVSAQCTYQSGVPEYPETLSKMLKQMGTEMQGISRLQYRATIDIQQTIYDGGAINAQHEVSNAGMKVQEAKTNVDIYALRERVNDLFFAVLLLDQRLKLNETMQSTIEANYKRIATLNEGGVAMQCDVDAMSAELATVRQQHVEIEYQREAFLKVLSLFAGKVIDELETPSITENETSEWALRPEPKLFDEQIWLINAKEKALHASHLPKIAAFAQGYYGYLGMNMFRDMTERTPTLNGIVGIRANWNLSALYTNSNDRAKLEVERQTIYNNRDLFQFNQNLKSEQEDSNISRYEKLISEDNSICSLRKKVREAAEGKLEAGIIDVNALILEINRENQANINKVIHETELLQHQYKLKNIKGE